MFFDNPHLKFWTNSGIQSFTVREIIITLKKSMKVWTFLKHSERYRWKWEF
jgi:hypothetical protein